MDAYLFPSGELPRPASARSTAELGAVAPRKRPSDVMNNVHSVKQEEDGFPTMPKRPRLQLAPPTTQPKAPITTNIAMRNHSPLLPADAPESVEDTLSQLQEVINNISKEQEIYDRAQRKQNKSKADLTRISKSNLKLTELQKLRDTFKKKLHTGGGVFSIPSMTLLLQDSHIGFSLTEINGPAAGGLSKELDGPGFLQYSPFCLSNVRPKSTPIRTVVKREVVQDAFDLSLVGSTSRMGQPHFQATSSPKEPYTHRPQLTPSGLPSNSDPFLFSESRFAQPASQVGLSSTGAQSLATTSTGSMVKIEPSGSKLPAATFNIKNEPSSVSLAVAPSQVKREEVPTSSTAGPSRHAVIKQECDALGSASTTRSSTVKSEANAVPSSSKVQLPGVPAPFPLSYSDSDSDVDMDLGDAGLEPGARIAGEILDRVGMQLPPPMRDDRDEQGLYFGRGRDLYQGPQARVGE